MCLPQSKESVLGFAQHPAAHPGRGRQCHPIREQRCAQSVCVGGGLDATALPVGLLHGQNDGPDPAQAGREDTVNPSIYWSPCLECLHSDRHSEAFAEHWSVGVSLRCLEYHCTQQRLLFPAGFTCYEGRLTQLSQPHHMLGGGKYYGGQNSRAGGSRKPGSSGQPLSQR